MKAMVLAAGLGTRLRPLTDDRPKALVTVAGRTMLEITLARLHTFGVRDVIVNAHHFAEEIVAYLQEHGNFGMLIEVSREKTLLDTGGGLKKAAWFFAGDEEPFLLHNVDVVSGIDLGLMVKQHQETGALATLAVQRRESSRQLLFDADGLLQGRAAGAVDSSGAKAPIPGESIRPGSSRVLSRLESAPGDSVAAFCGIHVISPRLLTLMTEEGAFSIIDCYLRLAARGERIAAFRADGAYWRDLGKPENVAAAGRDLESGVFALG
jgi:NDP-sugar pyrophosphorylase family protein